MIQRSYLCFEWQYMKTAVWRETFSEPLAECGRRGVWCWRQISLFKQQTWIKLADFDFPISCHLPAMHSYPDLEIQGAPCHPSRHPAAREGRHGLGG
jgi:hypothetical protein